MIPSGVAQPTRGIRAFIVGHRAAAASHDADRGPSSNSEARDSTSFGVLRAHARAHPLHLAVPWRAGRAPSRDAGTESCVYGAPVVTITSPAPGTTFPPGATREPRRERDATSSRARSRRASPGARAATARSAPAASLGAGAHRPATTSLTASVTTRRSSPARRSSPSPSRCRQRWLRPRSRAGGWVLALLAARRWRRRSPG